MGIYVMTYFGADYAKVGFSKDWDQATSVRRAGVNNGNYAKLRIVCWDGSPSATQSVERAYRELWIPAPAGNEWRVRCDDFDNDCLLVKAGKATFSQLLLKRRRRPTDAKLRFPRHGDFDPSGISRVVLANDWSRSCPECGEPQRLELRKVKDDRSVRDQPKCGACRKKRRQ